jgi:PBP1b-binding outer membrane lipoprotein LpoB
MKKLLVILLSVLLVMMFLSGCGKEEEPEVEPAVEEPAETMTEDTVKVIDTTMIEEEAGETTEGEAGN